MNVTQEQMNLLVPQKLREIEQAYGVTVLWAVESGINSRPLSHG